MLSGVSEIEFDMNANDAIKVLILGHDKKFYSVQFNSVLLLKALLNHYLNQGRNFNYSPYFHDAHFVSKAFKRNFKPNNTQVILVAVVFVALDSIEFFSPRLFSSSTHTRGDKSYNNSDNNWMARLLNLFPRHLLLLLLLCLSLSLPHLARLFRIIKLAKTRM